DPQVHRADFDLRGLEPSELVYCRVIERENRAVGEVREHFLQPRHLDSIPFRRLRLRASREPPASLLLERHDGDIDFLTRRRDPSRESGVAVAVLTLDER